MVYGKATLRLLALDRAIKAAIARDGSTVQVGKRRNYRSSLANVIDQTAKMAGCDYSQAATLISYFFEHAAAAVCRGEIVQIRGFGSFFPYARMGKHQMKSAGAYVTPYFLGAKGFRQQLASCCPVDKAKNVEALKYRAHHTRRKGGRQCERVFTAQDSYRKEIKNHAKREGELVRFDQAYD